MPLPKNSKTAELLHSMLLSLFILIVQEAVPTIGNGQVGMVIARAVIILIYRELLFLVLVRPTAEAAEEAAAGAVASLIFSINF